jgi:hypothetical protein
LIVSSVIELTCFSSFARPQSSPPPPHSDAPACKTKHKQFVGLSSDQANEIVCDMHSNPSRHLRYFWSVLTATGDWTALSADLLNSSKVDEDGSTDKPFVRLSTDRLSIMSELRCQAENRIGKSSDAQSCRFALVAAGPPGPLANCTQANLTQSSFTIQCFAGFSGGLQQTFHLELWIKPSAAISTATGEPDKLNSTTVTHNDHGSSSSLNQTERNPTSSFTSTSSSSSTSTLLSQSSSTLQPTITATTAQPAATQMFDFASSDQLLVRNQTTKVHLDRLHSSTVGYRKLIGKLIERNFRLIANLSSFDYPFFAIRSLPINCEFQLILYASNVKGRGKELHLSGNTLTASHWQTGKTLTFFHLIDECGSAAAVAGD